MDIYYDTEFLEDGRTIDLISIGLVRSDGREYYAIADDPGLIYRAACNPWLRENVLPSLPLHSGIYTGPDNPGYYVAFPWDVNHWEYPAVKPRSTIANEVRDFILDSADPWLWAWYGAYDHVVLCQMWGSMGHLPPGIPMWTNDLRQEAARLGDPELPGQASGVHNALADARHNKVRGDHLAALAGTGQAPHVICSGDLTVAKVDYSVPGHPRNVHADGTLCDHPGQVSIRSSLPPGKVTAAAESRAGSRDAGPVAHAR